MKRIFLNIILLVMAVVIMAGETPIPHKGNGNKKNTGPRSPAKEESDTGKKGKTPKKIFRPSEKIGADTVVAFPVDI